MPNHKTPLLHFFASVLCAALVLPLGCSKTSKDSPTDSTAKTEKTNELPSTVPDWAVGALFYQIFPERFYNGDASNDPTRKSLEFPENVSDNWSISPWTGDWYARADWEIERGNNFFAQGVFDRRYGGDLQGVLKKLDYLQQLGINAIYFNPVFYAKSLHKYDGNSYHHIDPYFGPDPEGDLKLIDSETSDPSSWHWTAADKLFLQIVKEAHDRDMRVIIDGVFNHTGRNFFAFQDLAENQEKSPYKDWYIVQKFDDPSTPVNEFKYKGWWGVDTLPEFADNADGTNLHPGPKEYVFASTARWMDPNNDGNPADGIDGWRLDVATEVPVGFWKEWHAKIRAINPEVYTVAEHWENAAQYLADADFSATMNYHGFAYPVKGFIIDGILSATDFSKLLTTRLEQFPTKQGHALLSLIDSHDTDRVASMVVNAPGKRSYLQPEKFDFDLGERVSPRNWNEYDVRKPTTRERRIQRMVAVMQITWIGAPMFYYGTESGMWGGDDPCCRAPMVWEEFEYDSQAAHPLQKKRPVDSVGIDSGLWDFYQSAFWLRRQLKPLRAGEVKIVLADDERKLFGFQRIGENASAFIFFNRSEENHQFSIYISGKGEATEVFTSSGEIDLVSATIENGMLHVKLPGLESVVILYRPAME